MSTFNKSWRRGVVAIAVSAALGFAATAYAADSSGIVGSIDAGAGYSVVIKNTETGVSRELTTDASGAFRFTQLPVGEYEVTASKDGKVVAQSKVRVSLGSNAIANFDVQSSGAEVIEVVGARPSAVDVTTMDSGLILGESQIDAMPVARNLTSIALLAPGTVPGESRFGNVASFGGSSVAENSCYINGLEVTDTRQGLGCGSVPFEFYEQFQVKTGGYSAQFGRTTGGLINTVTKSGTNTWEFGATATWWPESLREKGSTSYSTGGTGAQTGNGGVLGVFRDFSEDTTDFKELNLSVAGPLIEDKLFIYALYNPREVAFTNYGTSGTAQRTAHNRYIEDDISGAGNAFWGTKVDWDIVENHRLSVFAYSDRRDVERDTWLYNANTGVKSLAAGTTAPAHTTLERGGEATSVSYTGHITDDLTVSAMVGEIETQFFNRGSNTTCPFVTDSRGTTPTVPTCFVANDGTNFDKNKQKRLDVEWLIGDSHALHAGLDYQDRQSENTTTPSGGAAYTYTREAPNASIQIPGHTFTNTTGADLDVVAKRVFSGGGGFHSDMKAFYVEDQWQVANNVVLNIGIRKDYLVNYGTTEIAFADFSETAPRLGVSWDVNGDGASKLTATWGRYFLPIANNTNFRMASGISDATTYYRFAGATATFDAIGVPTNITPVNGNEPDSTSTNSLPIFPDTSLTQAKEASPFYKDELILGYERELAEGLRGSVRAIMRDVSSGLDDYCGDLAPSCVLLNPGEGGTWGDDFDGDGMADGHGADTVDGRDDSVWTADSYVYHTAADIGLPKAKNEYRALQFELSQTSVDTNWTFQYSWSRSYGNFEGAVKSDIAQADAGITQDFDFPALVDGSSGYQSNDRRHVIKFFGNHKLSEAWTVGWNSVLSSGRPVSAFGRGYPDHSDHIYGSYGDTFYLYTGSCPDTNGTAGCQQDEKIYVRHTRGDMGRTPWTFNLNLSLDYNFSVGGVDMKASLDVFNVLNSQSVTAVNEHYESSEGVRNQYYGSAYTFQEPRYVVLGFEARF